MVDSARKLEHSMDGRGLRWEILSHSELPGGAITWLRVSPAANDLTSAMLARDLLIEETGVVARLRICNAGKAPVLLPSDLVLDGGKQARVVERSVIVPAFAVAEVPVRCVESGRWAPRDAQTAKSFEVTSPAAIDTREYTACAKQRRMRTNASYDLEQSDVWQHVERELHASNVASTTRSYTAFLSFRAERVAEARKLDVQPPDGANGLALARPNGVVWIEVFPTREDMCSIVPTVVADALEPMQGHQRFSPRSATLWVQSAVTHIGTASLVAVPAPSATLGDTYVLDGQDVAGSILLYAGRVAHLVARVAS
jgi:hypothetical protein